MQPDQYPLPQDGVPQFGQNPPRPYSQPREVSNPGQNRNNLIQGPHELASKGQIHGAQPVADYSPLPNDQSPERAAYNFVPPQGGATHSAFISRQSTTVPLSSQGDTSILGMTHSSGGVQEQQVTYQTQVVGQRPEIISSVRDQSVTNQDMSYQQSLATGGYNSRYISGAQGTYSASQYSTQRLATGATETMRFLGIEYGPERVVSVQHVEQGNQVINEREVEREILVPKKIWREEVYEVIRPEIVIKEEIVQETQKIKEKVREVGKAVVENQTVERPIIEHWEKIIQVPQIEYREKIREEVQIQRQERIVEVPKDVVQERIVHVPEVQYREVPVEKVVEIPEIREEVVVRQVPVPQYVDKPVPQYVEVEVADIIDRNIPVPVEAVVAYEFRIPRLKGHYTKVTYPVYLPRFIETPILAELYNATITHKAEHYLQQISSLTRTAASLCEIENLATAIMQADLYTQCQQIDVHSAVLQAWNSGLQITGGASTGMVTTSVEHQGISHSSYITEQQGYGMYASQTGATSTPGTITTNTNAQPTHHHESRGQRRTVRQGSHSPTSRQ